MTFEQMKRIEESVFEAVRKLRGTKGREYAHDEDTLADFKEVAAEADITPLQCWLTYVQKHQRAITAYARRGEVLSEPIEGRIHDVIVYHILLLGLIEDARVDNPAVTTKGLTIREHDHGSMEDCHLECPGWDPTHGDRR